MGGRRKSPSGVAIGGRRPLLSRIMPVQVGFLAAVAAALLLVARPAASVGDRGLGEYLSSECVTCHQLSGKYEGIPPIIGWPEAIFIQAMNEYRSKQRSNPVMQTIAGRLNNEEIAALAAYFGSLKSAN
jgi:cytochrome c553